MNHRRKKLLAFSAIALAALAATACSSASSSSSAPSEQNLVAQFYKAGLIPSAPNMSGFVTTQFNASVSGG